MFFHPNKLWSTGLFLVDNIDFENLQDLSQEAFVLNSKKIRKQFRHTHTFADPFLFEYNDSVFLFVEEKKTFEKGKIRAYESKDGIKWFDLGIVLQEDFHLSYPFVFKVGDEVYMIPETSEIQEVVLYRAEKFPLKWKKEKVILNGKPYCDTSLVFHENKFWLFTNIGYNELHVFYSDSIFGDWEAHKKNPVINNFKTSRNGGGPFIFNDLLYRCSQDCSDGYGNGITISKVLKMNEDDYSEKKISYFKAGILKWNKFGVHHFNFIKKGSKYLIAIDGKGYDFLLNKVLGLIFKILK